MFAEKRLLLEKWLSIRFLLTGYAAPQLSKFHERRMEADFVQMSTLWDEHPEIATLNGAVPRNNILNLNMVFWMLLLFQGHELWLRHKDEFPQVSVEKRAELYLHWTMLCDAWNRPVIAPVVPMDEPSAPDAQH